MSARFKRGCLSVLALSLVILWSGSSLLAAVGALDGKTFVGQMGKEGAEKGNPDNFVFKDGKFRSTACDPYGFGDGAYTTAVNEDAVTFETTTTSPTDGTMVWKGMAKGQMIEGTASWAKKPGEVPVEHWFKGELEE